jgi:hypothetical protein
VENRAAIRCGEAKSKSSLNSNGVMHRSGAVYRFAT